MSNAARWMLLAAGISAVLANLGLAIWSGKDVGWAIASTVIVIVASVYLAYLDFREWEQDNRDETTRTD